jgi:hypothetical protein
MNLNEFHSTRDEGELILNTAPESQLWGGR